MKKTTLVCLSTMLLAGCSLFYPYEPPVQQGKKITPEMIKQVKPNMKKSQVEYILGTPDIITPLESNTWIYVYTIQQNHRPMEEKQLIIHFKDSKLTSMAGDYPPPTTVYETKKQQQSEMGNSDNEHTSSKDKPAPNSNADQQQADQFENDSPSLGGRVPEVTSAS